MTVEDEIKPIQPNLAQKHSQYIDRHKVRNLPEAIAIVDPASSGSYLKGYISQTGRKVIGILSFDENNMHNSIRSEVGTSWTHGCDDYRQCKNVNDALLYLRGLPVLVIAIIAGAESGVELADSLAHRLNLVGNHPDTSKNRRNKFEMRKAMKDSGITSPDFQLCDSATEAIQFADKHQFPVMVKTLEGSHSVDIYTCHSAEEVQNAFDRILHGHNAYGQMSAQVLVEEHLNGPQYYVEIFAVNGALYEVGLVRAYFDSNNRYVRDDYCVKPEDRRDLGHLIEYAFSVAKAAGLRWGPGFVELRDVPGKGPVLIEVNSRLSGAGAPLLKRAITSPPFDSFKTVLDVYTHSSNYELPQIKFCRSGALCYLLTGVSGTIVDIRGLDRLQQLKSYVAHIQRSEKGHKVEATDTALILCLANTSVERLENDIEVAKHVLRVEVE